MTQLQWPVFAFAATMYPGVCSTLDAIAAFEEPLGLEELLAFDAGVRRVHLRQPESEGHSRTIQVAVAAGGPAETEFRAAARTALRLHGPGAVWRWGRLRQPSDLDTFGMETTALQRLLSHHFQVVLGP